MRALCLFAFCLAVAAHAYAGIPRITRLAPKDRAALEHPASIKLFYSVSAIPAPVRSACATVISDHNFRLADPGKDYNEGCDADHRIPDRRLIWAAQLPDRFVVHYESGGRAHSFHIIVVSFPSSRPVVVWRAPANKYEDYSSFVAALRRNQLFDDTDYKF
jgi:hypothetical protein